MSGWDGWGGEESGGGGVGGWRGRDALHVGGNALLSERACRGGQPIRPGSFLPNTFSLTLVNIHTFPVQPSPAAPPGAAVSTVAAYNVLFHQAVLVKQGVHVGGCGRVKREARVLGYTSGQGALSPPKCQPPFSPPSSLFGTSFVRPSKCAPPRFGLGHTLSAHL